LVLLQEKFSLEVLALLEVQLLLEDLALKEFVVGLEG
jgi:hypothetical protein